MARQGRALEVATRGSVVTQILEGRNTFDLVARTGDPDALTAERIGATLVDTPDGRRIPLAVVAAVHEDRSPNFISRENAQRKIVVTCNVSGRDVQGVVSDIERAVASDVEMPPGYHVEYGGQFESAERTSQLLVFLGAVIVAGISGLLYFMFRSARDTLLILINLPLALMGGVFGVWASGGALSVASLIGFITVFGIAARNGIMMITHIRHLQEAEGVRDFRTAVRQGAMERLSPILMTALAAGLALVPLALRGEEPGNEILTPMAIVILFGLLSSTFLNMVLVPALYLRLGRPIESGSAEAITAGGEHA
jgi:Cu/Ag efflux pump CusA